MTATPLWVSALTLAQAHTHATASSRTETVSHATSALPTLFLLILPPALPSQTADVESVSRWTHRILHTHEQLWTPPACVLWCLAKHHWALKEMGAVKVDAHA
eukprot:SAG31_NODE_15528_length_750_cov_1.142857_1_plen_102_part_10